jgi:hypothetical protein
MTAVDGTAKDDTMNAVGGGPPIVGGKTILGDWLPLTTVALGVALTFIWTVSLLGLSVWALLLLV